jgi:hypothetical protein
MDVEKVSGEARTRGRLARQPKMSQSGQALKLECGGKVVPKTAPKVAVFRHLVTGTFGCGGTDAENSPNAVVSQGPPYMRQSDLCLWIRPIWGSLHVPYRTLS